MKKPVLIGLIVAAFAFGSITSQQFGSSQITDAHANEVIGKLPIQKMQEFSEVFTRIRTQYVEDISAELLIEKAIAGMVSSLDPHSRYLSEKELNSFQKGLTGEKFGGLGIYVGIKDGWIEVISPIFDTPAHRANLKSGDLILKIDGISTQNMEIDAAVSKMRGKVGALISIEVFSSITKKTRKVDLIREKITSPSVVSTLLKDDYAYLRISRFQDKTVNNLVENLNSLYAENNKPLKGIILDLRNNPGGFLFAGIDVAATFIPAGQRIVSDKGHHQAEKIFYSKTDYSHNKTSPLTELQNIDTLETVPLVVLVNQGSASASEIVAGAIQDTKRGVIIGERTYGKASVQSVSALRTSGGKTALRLTTARYYTPSGASIQATGIVPDVPVKLNTTKDTDVAEKTTFSIRESDIDGHLENQDKAEDKEAIENFRSDRPAFINKKDNQYDQALSILKALAIVAK